MEKPETQKCILISRAGLSPFKRCQYCRGPLLRCFSFQFSLISILIVIFTLFLVEMDSLQERIILTAVLVTWVVLVYLVSKETDRLMEAEYLARQSLEEKTRAEERFRRLFEDASDAIYIIEPETGSIIDCNRRASEMVRYSREELLNMTIFDLTPDEPRESIAKRLQKTLSDKGLSFEAVHVTSTGDRIDVEVTSRLIEWDHRSVVQDIVRDVSQRKEAERHQADLLSLLNETIANMPDGVFLLDRDSTVVFANHHALRCLEVCGIRGVGDSLKEIGGMPPEKFLVTPPRVLWHEMKINHRVFEIGGRKLSTGLFNGYIFVIRDITEKRQREERLNKQARLAALGQMASGIAHDFRNLLAVIIGCAENLSEHDLPGSAGYEVKAIMDSAYKASAMIEQILDFGRARKTDMEEIALADVLQTFRTFIKRLLPENIELVLDIKDPCRVVASESMLQQVLANLVINSRDAMPRGGRIVISLSEMEFTEKDTPLSEMSPGRWVVLQVSDTGTGIPEESIEHVFKPFFTTKKDGTGLGLSQVYGIVTQHRGHIEIKSKPSVGTTVTIYLPSSTATTLEVPTVARESVPEGKGEHILVVEDEEELAQMLMYDLQNHGYRASVAYNGKEALEMIQRERFDLIITDLIMPVMSGKQLVEILKQTRPEIKIIVITGYTTEPYSEAFKRLKDIPLFSKPFSLRQLRKEIAKILHKTF